MIDCELKPINSRELQDIENHIMIDDHIEMKVMAEKTESQVS